MKNQTYFLSCQIALIASIFTSIAHAGGPGAGGGGSGYVCYYNGSNKVASYELVDLWNARNIDHVWLTMAPPEGFTSRRTLPASSPLNIPYTNEPVDVQLGRALIKLKNFDPRIYKETVFALNYIEAHTATLAWDQMIRPPQDVVDEIYAKKSCPPGQWTDGIPKGIMYFDNDHPYTMPNGKMDLGGLVIDDTLHSFPLNNTQVAASKTHEALGVVFRQRNVIRRGESAELLRRFNACLFATDDCFGSDLTKSWVEQSVTYSCATSIQSFSDIGTETGPFKIHFLAKPINSSSKSRGYLISRSIEGIEIFDNEIYSGTSNFPQTITNAFLDHYQAVASGDDETHYTRSIEGIGNTNPSNQFAVVSRSETELVIALQTSNDQKSWPKFICPRIH